MTCHSHNKHQSTNATPTIAMGVLTGLTILSGAILTSPNTNAEGSAGVNLSVTVPSACSLTITEDTLSTTIIPGNNGVIGTSTIQSICNDPAGLAVYAVGYTNDTYGNNTLTSTVGSNNYTIASNATTSGTPANSEWNMTLQPVTGDYAPEIVTGYSSAHTVPNVYTKVAYRNAMTDMGTNATGAKFTATFNAYIANTQAAGTYTGKVKFLLVHPNVLTYNDQTGEPDTVQPATLPCEPAEYDTFDTSVTHYLQDIDTWKNQVALEQEVTAYDRRDNQAYKVKRLKMSSNGCQTALWMSNLNLGAQAFASGVTQLDNTNTNLPNDSTKFITASDYMNWDRTVSGNSPSYTDPKFTPLTAANASNGQAQDSYGNKYGTLYNYAAASAGTYVYEFDSGAGDAQYDLCPAGWRMPTGGSSGELKTLTDSYDLSTNWSTTGFTSMQQDLGFSLAGYFHDGGPNYQGSHGRYWLSTFYTMNKMHDLSFYEYYLDPAGNIGRYYGYSVRCIAQ